MVEAIVILAIVAFIYAAWATTEKTESHPRDDSLEAVSRRDYGNQGEIKR